MAGGRSQRWNYLSVAQRDGAFRAGFQLAHAFTGPVVLHQRPPRGTGYVQL